MVLVPARTERYAEILVLGMRRALFVRAFEDLLDERLELALLPQRADTQPLEHHPRQHQAQRDLRLVGLAHGLLSFAVTILAIRPGVGCDLLRTLPRLRAKMLGSGMESTVARATRGRLSRG